MLIGEFLEYMFAGRTKRSQREVVFDEVKRPESQRPKSKPSKPSQSRSARAQIAEAAEYELRNKIVVQVNRILAIACLASLGLIIVFSLKYPDKKVPEIMALLHK